MKKVYISIPMTNKTKEEIIQEINKRKECLEELGFEVISSFIENNGTYPDKKHNEIQFLGYSLIEMSDCDIAYFCRGWEFARGCKVEYETATKYGLQIITED